MLKNNLKIMEKEKIFKYFRKMLSEIRSEELISIGKNCESGINITKPEVIYVKLEMQNIPSCFLQKTKTRFILGNKFADVEISEEEFNSLLEETQSRLEEIEKIQINIMEDFIL